MVSGRSIVYFETRVNWRTLKRDNSRRTSRRVSLKVEKVVEIGTFLRLKCFVSDRKNFVLYALINLSQCKDLRMGEIWLKWGVLANYASQTDTLSHNTSTRVSQLSLLHVPIYLRLKITYRSFTHNASDSFPKALHQPEIHLSHIYLSDSPASLLGRSASQLNSQLNSSLPSIIPNIFSSQLSSNNAQNNEEKPPLHLIFTLLMKNHIVQVMNLLE